MIATDFGSRLKEAIGLAGETQESVAVKLDVAQTTVSAWATGRSDLPSKRLIQLADLLGVSLDWLAGRTDDSGQRLSPRQQAWLSVLSTIEEDGIEAVAAKLTPRSPEYAVPLGPPVRLDLPQ